MYKNPWNLNDVTINIWPYWLFEENIKIINSISSDKKNIVDLGNPSLQGPLQ